MASQVGYIHSPLDDGKRIASHERATSYNDVGSVGWEPVKATRDLASSGTNYTGAESEGEIIRKGIADDLKGKNAWQGLNPLNHWFQAAGAWSSSKKAKKAHAEFKRQQAQHELRGIAGEEAAAYGGWDPVHNPKANAANWAASVEQAQAARRSGQINMAYGKLPTQMRDGRVYNTALASNAIIRGTIDRSAGMARDASAENNVAGSEAAARQASFGAAQSGLTGSTVDEDSRQNVLGGYLGGRADTALAAAGTRSAGRGAIEQERLGALETVATRGKVDFGKQVADLSTINALGQAARGIPMQAAGRAIGDMGQLYANNLLYGRMASSPVYGGGGASMPSLSGGSKPTGGLSTTAVPRTR